MYYLYHQLPHSPLHYNSCIARSVGYRRNSHASVNSFRLHRLEFEDTPCRRTVVGAHQRQRQVQQDKDEVRQQPGSASLMTKWQQESRRNYYYCYYRKLAATGADLLIFPIPHNERRLLVSTTVAGDSWCTYPLLKLEAAINAIWSPPMLWQSMRLHWLEQLRRIFSVTTSLLNSSTNSISDTSYNIASWLSVMHDIRLPLCLFVRRWRRN